MLTLAAFFFVQIDTPLKKLSKFFRKWWKFWPSERAFPGEAVSSSAIFLFILHKKMLRNVWGKSCKTFFQMV